MERSELTRLTSTSALHDGRPRQRAPRRSQTHKAQVSVPEDFWKALGVLAEQAGTTTNDVLVQLAQLGYREHDRSARLQRIADARWAAFRHAQEQDPADASSGALTDEEIAASARAFAED